MYVPTYGHLRLPSVQLYVSYRAMKAPKTYSIQSPNGHRGRAWEIRYASPDDAAEALRIAMGWETISLTDWSALDGGGKVCRAYESYDERDADDSGTDAPRIVESLS